MLVLTRKVGQSIIIDTSDGPIVIQPVDMLCGKVRIGITAPKDLQVHRIEVYEAIHGKDKLRETLARAS